MGSIEYAMRHVSNKMLTYPVIVRSWDLTVNEVAGWGSAWNPALCEQRVGSSRRQVTEDLTTPLASTVSQNGPELAIQNCWVAGKFFWKTWY